MDPRDIFKNLTGIYGWAAERPGLMYGASAAALAAPCSLKNDERGYFKTSTMTTAGNRRRGHGGPAHHPTAVSEGKRLIDVVKQVPTDYGFRDGVYQAATGAVNISELRMPTKKAASRSTNTSPDRAASTQACRSKRPRAARSSVNSPL